MLRLRSFLPPFVLLALAPLACDQGSQCPPSAAATAASTAGSAPNAGVIVTVNGEPIHEADLRLLLKGRGNDAHAGAPADGNKAAVDTLVRDELVRQAAVAAGLDADPRYQARLRQMEADLAAFKRRTLAELYFDKFVTAKAKVSDEDARRYFAENVERIQTELHVYQILARGEGAATAAHQALEAGEDFEAVAKKRFPDLPETARKPWDLGYLKWNQVPAEWRDTVYKLKVGEASGVIHGPRNRFWIIKLVDKRVNKELTLDKIRPSLDRILESAKAVEQREQTHKELRAKAKIQFLKKPEDVRVEPPPRGEKQE